MTFGAVCRIFKPMHKRRTSLPEDASSVSPAEKIPDASGRALLKVSHSDNLNVGTWLHSTPPKPPAIC